MGERFAKWVVGVVVGSWVVTEVILPAAIKGYSPPSEMNTAMGVVAGTAAALIFTKRNDQKNARGQTEKHRMRRSRGNTDGEDAAEDAADS